MTRPPLPIDAVLPEVLRHLRAGGSAVLQAPTGAGKTTRVPPALAEVAGRPPGRIVVVEPRRIAARAAAARMAHESGTPLGERFGYHVRFERRWGPRTEVVAVTPGILLRQLQDDATLDGVAAVLFDEAHERGLEADLALGMVRLAQREVRPELRIVAMSATLDTARVAAYLGGCPVVRSEGRLFPVEVVYRAPAGDRVAETVAAALAEWLPRAAGDWLVFLPGMGEIRACERALGPLAEREGVQTVVLHGDVPAEQQDAALRAGPRRRIVLATNVAEASVTVEGVAGVIDSGLARELRLDPRTGLDRLTLAPISKASADQRAGRAGRLRPGVCVRLWGEGTHRSRPDSTEPEVRRVDLAGAALQLHALGEPDLLAFPWLDPPPAASVPPALALLRTLGAVDDAGLTPLGRRMAHLPAHPRLARLLVAGADAGCATRAALAAALLSERDPFPRPAFGGPRGPAHAGDSDLLDRVERLEAFRDRRPSGQPPPDGGQARAVLRLADQFARSLPANDRHPDALPRALLPAFADRVAKRRVPGQPRALMAGGRGARLAPESVVVAADLFLALDVDDAGSDALVRLASAVDRAWLPAAELRTEDAFGFDPAAEAVTATRTTYYRDLPLETKPLPVPADDRTAAALKAAASTAWERVLPAADTPAGRFRARVRWLGDACPDAGLPRWAGDDLAEVLDWLTPGCRSFADLRRADWLGAFEQSLPRPQRQRLERDAPETLTVPTGSAIKLLYEEGRPPVLAVRIQELFGWPDVPRLAGGRVKPLLHLLAPNYRPQQVTDDLPSFWRTTYAQVRKDLRARYPKHAWPDDPLTAPPQRGPKRRGT